MAPSTVKRGPSYRKLTLLQVSPRAASVKDLTLTTGPTIIEVFGHRNRPPITADLDLDSMKLTDRSS